MKTRIESSKAPERAASARRVKRAPGNLLIEARENRDAATRLWLRAVLKRLDATTTTTEERMAYLKGLSNAK